MLRERASNRVIELSDGRRAEVIEFDPNRLQLKVRFEDGTEEWVDDELSREVANRPSDTIERELGS